MEMVGIWGDPKEGTHLVGSALGRQSGGQLASVRCGSFSITDGFSPFYRVSEVMTESNRRANRSSCLGPLASSSQMARTSV